MSRPAFRLQPGSGTRLSSTNFRVSPRYSAAAVAVATAAFWVLSSTGIASTQLVGTSGERSGAVAITGTAASTLQGVSAAHRGAASIEGNESSAIGRIQSTATGAASITGDESTTLKGVSTSATGTVQDTRLWGSGNVSNIAGLSVTLLETDFLPGDTTTYVSSLASGASGTTPSFAITTVADLGSVACYAFSSAQVTTRASILYDSFEPDPDTRTASTTFSYGDDGLTWTALQSFAHTVPIGQWETFTPTFPAGITARYLRAVTVGAAPAVPGQTWNSECAFSDFRAAKALSAPPAPTLNAQGACEGTQNTLTWDSVSCATGYIVKRGGLTLDVGSVLTYVDDGSFFGELAIGLEYTYYVRAYNSAGYSDWSAASVFVPCPVSPGDCDCTWENGGEACNVEWIAETASTDTWAKGADASTSWASASSSSDSWDAEGDTVTRWYREGCE